MTFPYTCRQSACKMVRTLVQLMLALDNVPKEVNVEDSCSKFVSCVDERVQYFVVTG